jgi:hypothetical protein
MSAPEASGPAPTPASRRGRKRALAALLLLGALLLGLWAALPGIATMVLRDRMIAAGLPQPRLTVTTIGWHRAVIAGLHLGEADEVAIDRLTIEYDPAELLGLRFRRVEASGGHVAARVAEGRLSFGSLDRWLRRGGIAIPRQLSIVDTGLSVTLPGGLATVLLTGDFTTDDAGQLGGLLGVGGTLALGDFSTRIAGRIEAVLPPAATPTLTMQLDLVEPHYGDARFAPGQFLLHATPDGGSTNLHLGGAADPFMVAIDATVTLHDGRPQMSGAATLAATADAPIWTLLQLPRPQRGHLALSGTLSGGFPDAKLDWRQGEWNASLAGKLEGADWAGLANGVAVAGALELVGRGRTVTIPCPRNCRLPPLPTGSRCRRCPPRCAPC